MFKIIKLCVRCVVLAFLLGAGSILQAQQQKAVAPVAPLPAQIVGAKKVFISFGGGDSPNSGYSGGQERTYNAFYAAVKGTGKYQLVLTPSESDLVFEISFENPMIGESVSGGNGTPVSGSGVSDPHFRLTILDPITKVKLWTLVEHIEHALLQGNRDKNFDFAIDALARDLRSL
jgi:hypothetical protein